MTETAEVSLSVCAKLHELNKELLPGVAEDVALAMIRGAGEAFTEITSSDPSEATRRLLAALGLDTSAVLAALAH